MTRVFPPSWSLVFGMKMSDKCKSAPSNAMQVKKQRKTISLEGKLDVIS